MEDKKIIDLFFERSENAIKELDLKYGKLFFNLSNNIVNNKQDAEECVNDAYLGAWNTIPPQKPNPLLSYICRIVRNISIKSYWKNKKHSSYAISLDELEPFICGNSVTESEIEVKELTRIIEKFLDTLSKENRIIFIKRYWFCDSYKDIAEYMGFSEKNISVRLARIRQKLKKHLIEMEVLLWIQRSFPML